MKVIKTIPYDAIIGSIRRLELIYFRYDILCDADKRQILVVER